ncbi:hypothetical protein HMI54_004605 [Coelomomyces lativittatus]|nr:hypothetical protein HMI55_001466 [Coelomomyces lativittatus]KAJ1506995.1 hypothetical protein HMI54_004605 [Coelomomyces lativittatus]KAJ1514956.1 hypothetical protein HMI56_007006 [Coelomomyces lativittatus]
MTTWVTATSKTPFLKQPPHLNLILNLPTPRLFRILRWLKTHLLSLHRTFITYPSLLRQLHPLGPLGRPLALDGAFSDYLQSTLSTQTQMNTQGTRLRPLTFSSTKKMVTYTTKKRKLPHSNSIQKVPTSSFIQTMSTTPTKLKLKLKLKMTRKRKRNLNIPWLACLKSPGLFNKNGKEEKWNTDKKGKKGDSGSSSIIPSSSSSSSSSFSSLLQPMLITLITTYQDILRITWSPSTNGGHPTILETTTVPSSPYSPPSRFPSSSLTGPVVVSLKSLAACLLGIELVKCTRPLFPSSSFNQETPLFFLHQEKDVPKVTKNTLPYQRTSSSMKFTEEDEEDEAVQSTMDHENEVLDEHELEAWYESLPVHLRGAVFLQHTTTLCASHPFIHVFIMDCLKLCVDHHCPTPFLYFVDQVVFKKKRQRKKHPHLLSPSSSSLNELSFYETEIPLTLDLLTTLDAWATQLHVRSLYLYLLQQYLPYYLTSLEGQPEVMDSLSSSSSSSFLNELDTRPTSGSTTTPSRRVTSTPLYHYLQGLSPKPWQLRLVQHCSYLQSAWHPLYIQLSPHLSQVSFPWTLSWIQRFPTSPLNLIHFHFLSSASKPNVVLPSTIGSLHLLIQGLPRSFIKKLVCSLHQYHYPSYCSALIQLLMDEVDDLNGLDWILRWEGEEENNRVHRSRQTHCFQEDKKKGKEIEPKKKENESTWMSLRSTTPQFPMDPSSSTDPLLLTPPLVDELAITDDTWTFFHLNPSTLLPLGSTPPCLGSPSYSYEKKTHKDEDEDEDEDELLKSTCLRSPRSIVHFPSSTAELDEFAVH